MEILQEYKSFFNSVDDEIKNEFFNEETDVCANVSSITHKAKKLKPEDKFLMGQANKTYVEENYEEAIKYCIEVIKRVPRAPDPYKLLAEIYEELGHPNKSMQYCLLAAHLSKHSIDDWLSVADQCVELNNLNLAVLCYENACKIGSTNEQLWDAKCKLMEKAECDPKKILKSYRHILSIKSDAESYISLARNVFDKYMSLNDHKEAQETMLTAINLHPQVATPSDVNRLIDLFFECCNYSAALELLVKHFGVVLEKSTVDESEHVVLTKELHIDLKAKLLVSLIHLKIVGGIDHILQSLLNENCDDVGDLFLDVAEALMSENIYDKAEPLLFQLTNSQNYNMAAVWQRYGECLYFLEKHVEACSAFKNVVEMAPNHVDAIIRLSRLLKHLGQENEALDVLTPSDAELTESNMQLLNGKCLFLYEQGDKQDFIDSSTELLTTCCEQVLCEKYSNEILNTRLLRPRQLIYYQAKICLLTVKKKVKEIPFIGSFANDLWELYIKLYNILLQMKRYEELSKMSVLMMLCPAFYHDVQRSSELEFLCLIAGIANKNAFFAYPILRNYLLRELGNIRAWNLFGQLVAMSQDTRHNRFCIRLAMKHPDNIALCILNGHNALVAGSYKHALGEYFACLKKDPSNPFYHFIIGVTLTHIVSQKFCSHRHQLTNQACAFLNHYIFLRGECQESYYNIGRAMHQLGLTYLAVSYYTKALNCPPILPDDSIFDLTREIAFNLYVIYYSSGSRDLASHTLQKYLRI